MIYIFLTFQKYKMDMLKGSIYIVRKYEARRLHLTLVIKKMLMHCAKILVGREKLILKENVCYFQRLQKKLATAGNSIVNKNPNLIMV